MAGSWQEKLVWSAFTVATLQAATLKPYVILAHGSRVNLFTALLCAMAGLALVLVPRDQRPAVRPVEWIGSLLLAVLALASGLASGAAHEATLRAGALMASALGGYWCGRIIFHTAERRVQLAWLMCLALVLVLVLALGSLLTGQEAWLLMDTNPHPYLGRLIALCFGPLALALALGRPVVGWSLVGLGYLAMFASGLRSAMIASAVMLVCGLGLVRRTRKWLVAAVLLGAVMLAVFFSVFPGKKAELHPSSPPVYYRVESYAFAWHVALKHPWLGVGLRAPRNHLLSDYEIKFAAVSKQEFADYLAVVVTHENVALTMIAGVGLPFTLIYLGCLVCGLGVIVRRVIRAAPGDPDRAMALAIVLCLAGSLYHLMVYDGLLYPQVGWFFHLLLGVGVSLSLSRNAPRENPPASKS